MKMRLNLVQSVSLHFRSRKVPLWPLPGSCYNVWSRYSSQARGIFCSIGAAEYRRLRLWRPGILGVIDFVPGLTHLAFGSGMHPATVDGGANSE